MTGRETPSVAGIINPGAEGFQKLFFGQEEIAIPVHSTYVVCLFPFCIASSSLFLCFYFMFWEKSGIWPEFFFFGPACEKTLKTVYMNKSDTVIH